MKVDFVICLKKTTTRKQTKKNPLWHSISLGVVDVFQNLNFYQYEPRIMKSLRLVEQLNSTAFIINTIIIIFIITCFKKTNIY